MRHIGNAAKNVAWGGGLLLIVLGGILLDVYLNNPQSLDIAYAVPEILSDEMANIFPATAPTSDPTMRAKEIEFSSLLKKVPRNKSEIPIDFFRKNYVTFGPAVMLAVLNNDPLCHAEAHNLGRVIYEHTNDLAASTALCQSKCTAGCVHGALMGLFQKQYNKDTREPDDSQGHVNVTTITSQLRDIIATTCERSEITKYTGIGNCYHAVGHALTALADYDINSALNLCKIFEKKGGSAIYYCATGVYMERDISLGKEDSVKPALYPCESGSYPAACFRYKLRRVFNLPTDYKKVSGECLKLDGSLRRGCFHGLGFGAYKLVYENPEKLNELCATGDMLDRQMCVDGAIGLISVSNHARAREACRLYTAGDQDACYTADKVSNFGLSRDFSLYLDE